MNSKASAGGPELAYLSCGDMTACSFFPPSGGLDHRQGRRPLLEIAASARTPCFGREGAAGGVGHHDGPGREHETCSRCRPAKVEIVEVKVEALVELHALLSERAHVAGEEEPVEQVDLTWRRPEVCELHRRRTVERRLIQAVAHGSTG